MTVDAASRRSIVPAQLSSSECLLSGDESEDTEFRFGSVTAKALATESEKQQMRP